MRFFNFKASGLIFFKDFYYKPVIHSLLLSQIPAASNIRLVVLRHRVFLDPAISLFNFTSINRNAEGPFPFIFPGCMGCFVYNNSVCRRAYKISLTPAGNGLI